MPSPAKSSVVALLLAGGLSWPVLAWPDRPVRIVVGFSAGGSSDVVTRLAAEQAINPVAIKYINRLSDHLFVLARRLNDNGATDVLWVPGAGR